MLNSMTGYGSAEGHLDKVVYAVEIRTVNNRYFKSKVKLPDPVAFLEEDIDKLLRDNLSRGTINYVLQMKNVSADLLFSIDEKGLKMYMKRLNKIASSAGIDCPIDIGSLLGLPGIIQPVIPDDKQAKMVKKVVFEVTQKALDRLKKMRAVEGAAVEKELKEYCEVIKKNLDKVAARKETALKDYSVSLKKRIEGLLTGANLKLDDETLAKEVAMFAEKTDISEEVARLESHLKQFVDSCCNDGQAGRKMDFISQEMLREANTIASKAADAEITNWVVDIKCQIDRIKEQVQNVE